MQEKEKNTHLFIGRIYSNTELSAWFLVRFSPVVLYAAETKAIILFDVFRLHLIS